MPTGEMSAAVLRELPSEALVVTKVPAPVVANPDDVIVKIEACGICGTDLHIMDGVSYRPDLPFVLGHEPVGTVVEAGETAAGWLGRRVTISLFTGCGECSQCRAGDERLCPDVVSDTGVFGAWGGYAEYLLVHAAQLLEVPAQLSSSAAATLVDAGATAANSVRVALEGRMPADVLILGAGPIGLLSAEMLARKGVALQIIQRSASRRAFAAQLGHEAVESFSEARSGFDVVIDCTGNAGVFADGLAALGPQGVYVLAGYARVPEVDFAPAARKELQIRGIRSGRKDDLEEILNLAAAGQVRLPEVTEWPLLEINDAFRALRESRVAGKAIIVPDQSK